MPWQTVDADATAGCAARRVLGVGELGGTAAHPRSPDVRRSPALDDPSRAPRGHAPPDHVAVAVALLPGRRFPELIEPGAPIADTAFVPP